MESQKFQSALHAIHEGTIRPQYLPTSAAPFGRAKTELRETAILRRENFIKAEIDRIRNWAVENKLRILFLKGAALFQKEFNNRLIRNMSDIDILVSKEDLARARNLLVRDGYYQTVIVGRNRWQFELLENNRFREGRSAFLHASRMPIDLHTALNYGLGSRRLSLDVDAFWKTAEALDSYCFLPNPLYHFSHLVVHALEWSNPSPAQFLDCARVFKMVKPQWQGHGFTLADFQEFRKHIDPFIRSLDEAISTGKLNSFGKKLLRTRSHPAQIILMYRRGDLSDLKAVALYLLGYFFPNPDYYQGYSVPQTWFAHWAHVLRSPFRKAHARALDTSQLEAPTSAEVPRRSVARPINDSSTALPPARSFLSTAPNSSDQKDFTDVRIRAKDAAQLRQPRASHTPLTTTCLPFK